MRAIATLPPLALIAALALILAPAHAQSQSGAPLSLAPPPAKAKKPTAPHTTATHATARKSVHKAKAISIPAAPMRRGDPSVALISQLPWWQSDEKTIARHRDEAAMSQVLTATDAWLDSSAGATRAYTAASIGQIVAADDGDEASGPAVMFVEPTDFNALDSIADTHQPAPRPWLYGFLTLLAGGLAATAAARFLFV